MRWTRAVRPVPHSDSNASWVRVCSESDLTANQPVRVVIDELAVMVVRDDDGTIHALDDTCTHADISLSEGFVEGATVECWAHGARFDLRSGFAVALPASDAVRVHGVSVRDGSVFLTAQPDEAPVEG